jgi:hypothetical protein
MRVLIACEFSGIVRDAFAARGHDALSCDLLESESPARENARHFQGDVGLLLNNYSRLRWLGPFWEPQWDLLIAHPPCTFICNSSSKHLYLDGKKANGRDPQRWADMAAAAHFFKVLLDAPIPKIAIENPVMHGHAQKLIGQKQTQSIQPWQFGHGEIKRTCLWLKNLPPLTPTKIVAGREARVHRMPPGPDRWKERSRTLKGIAAAMAAQWG